MARWRGQFRISNLSTVVGHAPFPLLFFFFFSRRPPELFLRDSYSCFIREGLGMWSYWRKDHSCRPGESLSRGRKEPVLGGRLQPTSSTVLPCPKEWDNMPCDTEKGKEEDDDREAAGFWWTLGIRRSWSQGGEGKLTYLLLHPFSSFLLLLRPHTTQPTCMMMIRLALLTTLELPQRNICRFKYTG